jgi:broad specificity phosphatase PhoE
MAGQALETGAVGTSEATEIVLVRHGHVADNDLGKGARLCGWTDAPLSPLGAIQAERLAERLAHETPPAAVYTSTSRRARDTAAAVADRFGLRAHAWPSLREIGCGVVDGWTLARVRRRFPRLWAANLARADERFRWPGGESYRDFRMRCLRAIRWIAAAHLGARVVVVTHTGVITQVLAAIHCMGPARWDAFRAGNASVTVVRWDSGGTAVATETTGTPGAALLRFDDRSHLEGLPWRARGTHWQRPAPATGVAAGGSDNGARGDGEGGRSRLRVSAPPDGVGAAQDTQVVVRGARRLGAAARRRESPPIGDDQMVAQCAGQHVTGAGQPVGIPHLAPQHRR